MGELLRSVGLDVGTTTTQLILSELLVENRASSFAVPELEIGERRVIYRGPIRFTPLLSEDLVDGEAIRAIVAEEYDAAGICREDVDTGAIIITGETSRRENAAAVLQALSDYAGDFVVATAGPDLESVLAAKGAGAARFSEMADKPVLHMDIGGGTANLALLEAGRVTATACLNVGGRLIKLDAQGRITYRSPVLEGLTALAVGDLIDESRGLELARMLAGVLEMAAGLRPRDGTFDRLTTAGTRPLSPPEGVILSFSGGVADCIENRKPWLAFGDLGPLLGRAIRESALCRGEYRLGEETIRATVIGAGCHSAQLSGSTIYCQQVKLPMKNIPVAVLENDRPEAIRALPRETHIFALPGWEAPDYARITALAESLARSLEDRPCYIALEHDMAKALGVALKLRLPPDTPILCIDRVKLTENSYLDVGEPIGPALPVVVKTLVLDTE